MFLRLTSFAKKNRTKAIYNIKIKLKLGDLRPSPCTRLLFTILPAPYTSATLYDLLREWVADLNKLAMEGITVTWLVPTNPDVLKLSCFFPSVGYLYHGSCGDFYPRSCGKARSSNSASSSQASKVTGRS